MVQSVTRHRLVRLAKFRIYNTAGSSGGPATEEPYLTKPAATTFQPRNCCAIQYLNVSRVAEGLQYLYVGKAAEELGALCAKVRPLVPQQLADHAALCRLRWRAVWLLAAGGRAAAAAQPARLRAATLHLQAEQPLQR